MPRSSDEGSLPPGMRSVYEAVAGASGRLPAGQAVRLACRQCGLTSKSAQKAINQLVAAGRLRFVEDCGLSCLEKNFSGQHRLSPRVYVDISWAAPKDPSHEAAQVFLRPGSAFGDCRHPTTRLCIRALDCVLATYGDARALTTALDIGTGSGILAITAARLGVPHVVALDIDACARKEARENVAHNCLTDRIRVSAMTPAEIKETFSLVMANLRPPTLNRYAALISEKTAAGGVLVMSGMRPDETQRVVSAYQQWFECVRFDQAEGWGALVFLKNPGSSPF